MSKIAKFTFFTCCNRSALASGLFQAQFCGFIISVMSVYIHIRSISIMRYTETFTLHYRGIGLRYITVFLKMVLLLIIFGCWTSWDGPSPRQRHASIAVSAAAGPEQRCADFQNFRTLPVRNFCVHKMFHIVRCTRQ